MDITEVEAKLLELIDEALGWKDVKLTDGFLADLNAKSMDIFKLAMYIEKGFGTKVPVADLLASVTPGDMAKAIAAYL